MASEARPSIFEARGDGLPRFARRDGIFGLLFKVCVLYPDGFGKLAMTRRWIAVNLACDTPARWYSLLQKKHKSLAYDRRLWVLPRIPPI